ncbi:MAG TPA: hypothetical protein VIT43_00970 [Candidatus Dormibacteraeota bacterium]
MNSERAELASVMVVLQACFSITAALIALPFAVVEPGFRALGLLTIGVGAAMLWLARELRRQSRGARRCLIAIESISLLASTLLMLLPIGAVRGPVPLLVNIVLPLAVLVLVRAPRPIGAAGR